ncbi:MAG TPA: NUDIX domain-containing protein [Solirubrobacteraceae bacterium]|nr:NUDIX domain-containing protein [Solirubrobacteraceae bacterium]
MGISPYLRRLRERVGHDLVLMPAVAVLIWDEEGRVVLVRAADSGLWQTVGGSVEPDEDPLVAAVREAREEAGVDVAIDGVRAVLGGPEYRLTYPNGDIVSYVSTVFDAHVVGGVPAPDGDETLDASWFALGELEASALTPFTVALLRDALGAGLFPAAG